MKIKKLLSLILALAMIFSLGMSAFATDGDDDAETPADGDAETPAEEIDYEGSHNFEATATVNLPAINVLVATGTDIFINPMGFKVVIDTGAAADGSEDSTDVSNSKIVSPLYPIENFSPMKLDVNVIGSVSAVSVADGATSTVPTMSISAVPIANDDTKNSVFIYAQFGEFQYAEGTGVYSFKTTPQATYSAPADNATTVSQLALSTRVPTKATTVGSVAPASVSNDTVTPGYFGFQFRGDCNKNATKDWTPGESVTATLTFSFKPSASQT